jgi:hypothetical protein
MSMRSLRNPTHKGKYYWEMLPDRSILMSKTAFREIFGDIIRTGSPEEIERIKRCIINGEFLIMGDPV